MRSKIWALKTLKRTILNFDYQAKIQTSDWKKSFIMLAAVVYWDSGHEEKQYLNICNIKIILTCIWYHQSPNYTSLALISRHSFDLMTEWQHDRYFSVLGGLCRKYSHMAANNILEKIIENHHWMIRIAHRRRSW